MALKQIIFSKHCTNQVLMLLPWSSYFSTTADFKFSFIFFSITHTDHYSIAIFTNKGKLQILTPTSGSSMPMSLQKFLANSSGSLSKLFKSWKFCINIPINDKSSKCKTKTLFHMKFIIFLAKDSRKNYRSRLFLPIKNGL